MDFESEMVLERVLRCVNQPMETNHFVERVEVELQRIDEDLRLLNEGALCVRNKQRKKRRLMTKKEKMRVKINLALRDNYDDDLSPNERRSLQYYSRKFECDGEFLERKLCTELELDYTEWEFYIPA